MTFLKFGVAYNVSAFGRYGGYNTLLMQIAIPERRNYNTAAEKRIKMHVKLTDRRTRLRHENATGVSYSNPAHVQGRHVSDSYISECARVRSD